MKKLYKGYGKNSYNSKIKAQISQLKNMQRMQVNVSPRKYTNVQ